MDLLWKGFTVWYACPGKCRAFDSTHFGQQVVTHLSTDDLTRAFWAQVSLDIVAQFVDGCTPVSTCSRSLLFDLARQPDRDNAKTGDGTSRRQRRVLAAASSHHTQQSRNLWPSNRLTLQADSCANRCHGCCALLGRWRNDLCDRPVNRMA